MAQQDFTSAYTVDRSMAGAKGVGNKADLKNISGGWPELLKYWYLVIGAFVVPQLLGVPIFVMLIIFYIGIGFKAEGMLAKLIIAIGQNFNTPGKSYGGTKATPYKPSSNSQNDAQAMALQAVKNLITTSESKTDSNFSGQPTPAQSARASDVEFIRSGLANQKAIIDRRSAQNGAANILTWLVYLALIGFSCLLIYAGYNTEFFQPVAWIRHPVQAIYYGALGLAIVLPLFIYFSFMGPRNSPSDI